MDAPTTLEQVVVYFADFNRTRQFMIDLRWPDGVVHCPRCDSTRVAYLDNVRLWKCYEKHSRAKFSLKVGTIFEDSPLGLDTWLTVVWLVVNCKTRISSYEIARQLGLTQKSAWSMMQRIRQVVPSGTFETRSSDVAGERTFIDDDALPHDDLPPKTSTD